MPTMLARMVAKQNAGPRFEEIARDMVRQTFANEPGCLRYEYWRGAEPNHYYCLLSFKDNPAFYTHQASSYHLGHLPELMGMFESFSLEFVDPIAGAGSDLPRTRDTALETQAARELREQETLYPIHEAAWWEALIR